jgi:tetratricopeptide (TPR) repeat protein
MKMIKSKVHAPTERLAVISLFIPLLAVLLSACGSTPPPPSVPAFPNTEGSTKGIPTPAFTSFERGVAELEKKPANYIDAIKAFEQALSEYEGARDRQIAARAKHKAELDQHEADLAAWKKLHGEKVKEDPKLQSELKQRSEALAKQRAELDQGLLAPDYIVARLNLAYTLEKLGRYGDAVKAYKVLLDKGVSEATIRLAYGRSLLLSKRAKDSIKEFEAVLAADDRSLDARNNLAAAYLSLGDLETCLRYVKEVLAVQPKNVSAIINLGLLYLKDKKFDLAELMFMKAIKYDKVNARAYSNLGLTFYQTGRLPQAVVNFQKAIELDPSMDEARLNLASVYLDYLDYARALEQFNIVLGRFPQHYQALVGAADALYGTGKYKEAVNYYLESLKIND